MTLRIAPPGTAKIVPHRSIIVYRAWPKEKQKFEHFISPLIAKI